MPVLSAENKFMRRKRRFLQFKLMIKGKYRALSILEGAKAKHIDLPADSAHSVRSTLKSTLEGGTV